MKTQQIQVENFRLLKNSTVDVEKETSIILGKNNTEKTSLLAIFDKFFNLNPTSFNEKVQSVFRIMFSVSTFPFYGSILIMLMGYIIIVC